MAKHNKLFFTTNENNILNENGLMRQSYWLSWIIEGTSLLVLGLLWNSLPSKIPLFYSLPWGEARLATKGWIGLLPSLGIIFSGINWILSKTWWRKEKFLQKILAIVSLGEAGLISFIMLDIIGLIL